MALDDYAKSPLGLLNVFALDYVWLSGAQFLLFSATVILASVLIICSLPRHEIHERMSAGGLVFLLCITLVCELGSIAITIYYILVEDRDSAFYIRFITILILAVLFTAVVIVMIVIAHKFLNRVWAIEGSSEIHESVHHKVVTVTPTHSNVHLERKEIHHN